ncbi:hypothetical protein SAMD00019534_125150, partial [Acytostelium subglobosum LB1]|uniref:hypothetical protein n=1 Tax=Acytostelium subglobosum LB1 TaxID=1410327 RepID=UPI000645185C
MVNTHDIIYYSKAGRIESTADQDFANRIDVLDPQRSLVTLGGGISLNTLLNTNARDKPDDNIILFLSL